MPTEEKVLAIFHSALDDNKIKKTEGLVRVEDKMYYLPFDTNTLLYRDSLPSGKIEVKDRLISGFFYSLNRGIIDSLNQADYSKGCGIGMNDLIFYFRSENSKEGKYYYFSELQSTDTVCNCSTLLQIEKYFEAFHKVNL